MALSLANATAATMADTCAASASAATAAALLPGAGGGWLAAAAAAAPSIFFPGDTLPQWGLALLVIFAVWGRQFYTGQTPKAVLRRHAARKEQTEALAEAALLYTKGEMLKAEEDRNLPEPGRVLALLWDDVHLCRTTAYGIEPAGALNLATEQLFRDVAAADLRETMALTQQARATRVPGAARDAILASLSSERAKKVAEHESGEKLKEQLRFADKAAKHLGAGYVDEALLAEGRALARVIAGDQAKKIKSVLRLLKPVLPCSLLSIALGVVITALRARFHQIGLWIVAADAGAAGDIAGAQALLFNLWVGHMLIKILELPVGTFDEWAKAVFNQRIKAGVLTAMVRQDYAYFDKNSAGVLQDRLNRDADELGENLLGFPKKMIQKFVWVTANLYIVYTQSPLPFFMVAILPVIVQIVTQYFSFRYFREQHSRERKIEEESTKATSEVLRQIKTVRQFAMESKAGTEYAATGLSTHIIKQSVYLTRKSMEAAVWSFFDTGIALTLLIGFPYVASGQMTAAVLIDNFCKLNFNVNFALREIVEEIPKAAKMLEPLGRICDLLSSKPTIEPEHSEAFVDCADAAALRAVLACCESDNTATSGGGGGGDARFALTRVVDAALLAQLCSSAQRTGAAEAEAGGRAGADGANGARSSVPTAGSQLLCLKTVDHHHVDVHGKDAVATDAAVAALTFPVRAVFSAKLRPARFAGRIEFKDVHFSYPTDLRTPALRGINFVVEPGQKVALVGPSGCGKSSCMSLLQRFYDPLEGTILIDGRDLKDYDVKHLRSRVVIVDQSTVLFNRTIRENITYGMTHAVSDDEVVQALKDAQIWDFVDEKPDKLMTMITGNGSNLSGGERQRLAIARAIIRKPDVILLDEATSALDNENEAKVQKALDVLAEHGSALVIAHRLGTIKDSDKICVVDAGVVIEEGTHSELIKGGGGGDDDDDTNNNKDDDDNNDNGAGAGGTEAATFPAPAGRPTRCKSLSDEHDQGAHSEGKGTGGVKSKSRAATSYKKLWEMATGSSTGNMSLQQLAEKMAQMKADLAQCESKHRSMSERKSRLVAGVVAANLQGSDGKTAWDSGFDSDSSVTSPAREHSGNSHRKIRAVSASA